MKTGIRYPNPRKQLYKREAMGMKPDLTVGPGGPQWLRHTYHRTYSLCATVDKLIHHPHSYLEFWEEYFLDDAIESDLRPFQKATAIHRFAWFVADRMYESDLDGPRLVAADETRMPITWILPVDAALLGLGLLDEPFVPDDPDDRNAYGDYFLELMVLDSYQSLLEQCTDEVFHILFQNRKALGALHELLAARVQEYSACQSDEGAYSDLFTLDGRLRRKSPPAWAKNAVFHRDKGRCVYCGRDLSGLIDSLAPKHFDHVVPLANGGLNDVSNLQLTCEACNQTKGGKAVPPSEHYRRWYLP